jgi:hypothetical protein
MTELETSARPERKRMTNHNTPQLSGMDPANHCAAIPPLFVVLPFSLHLSYQSYTSIEVQDFACGAIMVLA